MKTTEQKIREIIQNYSHDFRDIKQTEIELETMIINLLFDLTNNCDLYPHIISFYKSNGSLLKTNK